MLEQELIFVENLKSELAKTPSDKLQAEMNGAAKRVKTLEDQLFNLTRVHQSISPSSCSPRSPPVRRYTHSEKENSRYSPITQHTRSLSHQISAPTLPKAEWNIISCSMPDDSVSTSEIQSKKGNGHVLNQAQKSLPLSCSLENISKQASSKGSSWPLQGSNHSRQSSNPDTLIHHIEDFIPSNRTPLSSPEFQNYNINNQHLSSRKCTASESFNEFEVGRRWKSTRLSKGSVSHADYTPPGTPPPDASSENVEYKDGCNGEDNTCFEEENFIESSIGSEEMAEGSEFNVSDNKPLLPDQKLSTPLSSPSQAHISPDMQSGNNTHGSSVRWSGQQPYIIGMEDDDFPSDTEMGQVEDHGPFKSMWSLMQNPAHLAVFIHYLMSNNDPSGLFFYVISDIYEQGTLKEMKKWAYEIHSSFLLPGAPLRIKNIDEAILNEIDDVLQHQLEKEEVIRAVFRKARTNAKKELKDLLADFRNKRALGLGNIYGPPDCQLELALHDKSKELKIIEQLLLPTVESIPEDLESASDKTLATASAVATILKQYGSKSTHVLNVTDRCPTFVSKEKGRLRILQRNKKVVFVQGHQFLPQHYHCVTYCNHCQLIIWGIGNQGYQCQNCEMNIHKYCVKIVEEHCIGTLRNKKDKKNYSVTGIVENIIGKTRKPSQPYPGAIERAKKINEEGLNADNTTTNTVSVVDVVTEPSEKATNTGRSERGSEDLSPPPAPISNLEVDILAKKATSIGRSESFRQRRENKPPFRKRSDPNIPRSKSSRSLDSPCNSIEMVHRTPTSTPADALPGSGPTSGIIQPHIPTTISLDQYNDSDLEADVDPPNWQDNIDWDVIRLMKPKEKKRQDVINELFHTERTHVRNLKILDRLFYRPLQQEQLLPPDLLQLLFPNLEEMLEIHSGFNNKMKAKRREEPIIGDVGEMMLNMLDGESGENLMTAAAKFCRNQSVALENLKSRQKKDQKLSQFLAVSI
ncbi:rho guanine nucleotide exchange factor 11-like [Centruroides sculpturatus]|uniref:rho guanine nucleotide exchange factor 11-like n=1 Tax=Centruroides sculpturatus TaxID=218467 RepID=UPI000C6ED8CC|nr:rho guanine nucleotide exchange factor 11-like [Centruroides sculpturatus]